MTEPKPIAVMDAQDPAQGTSALQHRLAWLRAEGFDPDRVRRVEVFSGEDGPYAVVESFVRDGEQVPEGAHVEGSVPDEPVRATVRRPVSSLPPREAAAYDLAARAGR